MPNENNNAAAQKLYDALIKEIRDNGLTHTNTVTTLQEKDVKILKAAKLMIDVLSKNGNEKDNELTLILNNDVIKDKFTNILEEKDIGKLIADINTEEVKKAYEEYTEVDGIGEDIVNQVQLLDKILDDELNKSTDDKTFNQKKEQEDEIEEEKNFKLNTPLDELGKNRIDKNETKTIGSHTEEEKNKEEHKKKNDFDVSNEMNNKNANAKKIVSFIKKQYKHRNAKDSLYKSVVESKEIHQYYKERADEYQKKLSEAVNTGDEELVQALYNKRFEYLSSAIQEKNSIKSMEDELHKINQSYSDAIKKIEEMNVSPVRLKRNHGIYIPDIKNEEENKKKNENVKQINLRNDNPFKKLVTEESKKYVKENKGKIIENFQRKIAEKKDPNKGGGLGV